MTPAIDRLRKFIPQRQLLLLSQIVLVALIGWQLALITWQFLPSSTSASVQSTRMPPRTQNTGNTLLALDSLNIFGAPPTTATAAAVPTVAPVSRLPAQITGLVASSDPAQSRVIIRMSGQDNIYRIGERLKGANARIENIYPDRVIIDHNGKFESLLMYPDEANKPRAMVVSAPPAQAVSLKERLKQNPASWSDLVSISPVFEGGDLQGYRLNPGKQPALFRKYGLQPGDLATAINGHELTNQQEAMKLMAQLPSIKNLSLAIIRNGQPVDVRIEL